MSCSSLLSREFSQAVKALGIFCLPAPEPALHYIRCALSYQNQLLADIKSLLERQAEDRAAGTPPAAEGANPEDNLSKL